MSLHAIGDPFKQAPRLADDPGINVSADGDDHLVLACGDSSIRVSRFNAARIFGCMALLLGIPLSTRIGKEIRL